MAPTKAMPKPTPASKPTKQNHVTHTTTNVFTRFASKFNTKNKIKPDEDNKQKNIKTDVTTNTAYKSVPTRMMPVPSTRMQSSSKGGAKFEVSEDPMLSAEDKSDKSGGFTESCTLKSDGNATGSRVDEQEDTLSGGSETENFTNNSTYYKSDGLKVVDKSTMSLVAEQNLREIGRNGFEFYRKQWHNLYNYKAPGTFVHFTKNTPKNRYSDVTCLDSSRVVLLPDEDSECNYIHANHVHGIFKERQYILTQGPKDTTVLDFWRMVWQQKSGLVINLVQPLEHKNRKCAVYWPIVETEALKIGSYRVENSKVTKMNLADNQELVISQLIVTRPGNTMKQRVMHCQWNNWPDKSAPVVGHGAIQLIKIINKYHQRTLHPVIAHCSAGIGRSGTLIALAMAVQYIDVGRLIDFPTLLRSLRMQRQHAIQRELQYLFLVRCFIDYCHHHKLMSKISAVCSFIIDYERFLLSETTKTVTDMAVPKNDQKKTSNEAATPNKVKH